MGDAKDKDTSTQKNGLHPKPEEQYDQVKLKKLPSFRALNDQVQDLVQRSSWWNLYGVDWAYALGALALVPPALQLLRQDFIIWQAIGVLILGSCHGVWANKCGHQASHGALFRSRTLNSFWMRVFTDFCGAFSSKAGYEEHVQGHHPHTNIIGMGDSATWKAPFVPCYPYMFLTPLVLPVLTPAVALYHIWGDLEEMFKFLVLASAGVAFDVWLLMEFSGFSLSGAMLCLYMIRGVLAIPFIHVNIFQHIGLPMYSQENRPVRIYQMSTGCLNLSRNLWLDHTFGHGLVNCHVEHHLFPRLSDNMCLQIKPLVRRFLLDNGLPYNEDSYWNRLGIFIQRYEELMVNAPPITHFVGLQ